MLLLVEVPEGAIVCDDGGRLASLNAKAYADIDPLDLATFVLIDADVVQVPIRTDGPLRPDQDLQAYAQTIEVQTIHLVRQIVLFPNERVAYVFDGGYCAPISTWFYRGKPKRAVLPPSENGWTYPQVMAAIQ